MSATAQEVILAATAAMPPVSLAEVVATADLQTRRDRKYLVPADVFTEFIDIMSDRFAVLEIQGRRLFRYESVYFDTERLTAYHQHAYRRRRRFKVRTRAYLDSADCVLEVKTEGGRGETIKDRLPYEWADRHHLTEAARQFALRRIGCEEVVERLEAVITTAYWRSTMIDPRLGSRLTCDVGLAFRREPGGAESGAKRHQGPADHVLVESKTVGVTSTADNVLWRLGQRPVPLSKFCVGMALLQPDLPANQWNRELRRYFDWAPLRKYEPA